MDFVLQESGKRAYPRRNDNDVTGAGACGQLTGSAQDNGETSGEFCDE
ncbi:hypothetical protein H650_17135 [Enterobacter sp. R4-368]|nr:hypothetical protein H650_17135 [Enterobacter sp. R4-368]